MFEKFTDRAKKVMDLANAEATRLNNSYVGTEHVLLGLMREGFGVGANVLKNLDVSLDNITGALEKLVLPDALNSRPVGTTIPLTNTPRTNEVIKNAENYAKQINHAYVGTEHLLYGLVADEQSISSQILKSLGLDRIKIISEIESVLGVPLGDRTIKVDSLIDKNLIEFLKNNDYNILEPVVLEKSPKYIVANNKGIGVGIVWKNGDSSNLFVKYDTKNFNESQIFEALKFRDFLDKNKKPYQESPSLPEASERIKAHCENLSYLRKSLEKRV